MNNSIPEVIYNCITSKNTDILAPAWIELEYQSSRIKTIGGAWQNYFDTTPKAGDNVIDICEVLQGMVPLHDGFELPQIQLSDHHYTDISAIHKQGRDWILFSDVTQHTIQIQQYQQTSNELTLLKAQLNRTLNRYVGQEVAERVANGTLQLNLDGERKLITTLFVDIRGFTPFNERNDAQVVMQTLNDYMDNMLKPILSHAGMVDKIIGDGIMAIFGVLPTEETSASNAFAAATNIINNIKKLNQTRKKQGLEQLGTGIGIATGDAVLGILGSHERRAFTAIGRHVNLAARLESNARAGEILVDDETFNMLKQPSLFSAVTLSLKGIGKTSAHTYTPE